MNPGVGCPSARFAQSHHDLAFLLAKPRYAWTNLLDCVHQLVSDIFAICSSIHNVAFAAKSVAKEDDNMQLGGIALSISSATLFNQVSAVIRFIRHADSPCQHLPEEMERLQIPPLVESCWCHVQG